MIHLVAILTAKPGLRDALLAAIEANRPAVLAEAGCLEYRPLIDDPHTATPLGADAVLICERWADEAALAAHRDAPHMITYRGKTRDILASRTLHRLCDA